jgi:hypothetical protein
MKNLQRRSFRGNNIGKALGLVMRYNETVAEAHYEVDAMYAPSECHSLITRSYLCSWRRVRRHIKAITGLNIKEFFKECEARTSPRWMHVNGMYPHC